MAIAQVHAAARCGEARADAEDVGFLDLVISIAAAYGKHAQEGIFQAAAPREAGLMLVEVAAHFNRSDNAEDAARAGEDEVARRMNFRRINKVMAGEGNRHNVREGEADAGIEVKRVGVDGPADEVLAAGDADVEDFGEGHSDGEGEEVGGATLSAGAGADEVVAEGCRHGAGLAVSDADAEEFIGIFCKVQGAGDFHLKALVKGEGGGVSIEALGTAGGGEIHIGGAIAAGLHNVMEGDLGEGGEGQSEEGGGKKRKGGIKHHMGDIFTTLWLHV